MSKPLDTEILEDPDGIRRSVAAEGLLRITATSAALERLANEPDHGARMLMAEGLAKDLEFAYGIFKGYA